MNPKEVKQKEKQAILTFWRQTREGKYAQIDESAMPYVRLREQREEPYEEEYYYSVR